MKNSVQLTGNLGNDAQIMTFASGKTMAKISLAVNEEFKGQDDTTVKVTQWHTVVFWNDKADHAKDLKKGSFVAVKGKLNNRSYEDKNGIKRTVTEIIGFEVSPVTKQS